MDTKTIFFGNQTYRTNDCTSYVALRTTTGLHYHVSDLLLHTQMWTASWVAFPVMFKIILCGTVTGIKLWHIHIIAVRVSSHLHHLHKLINIPLSIFHLWYDFHFNLQNCSITSVPSLSFFDQLTCYTWQRQHHTHTRIFPSPVAYCNIHPNPCGS